MPSHRNREYADYDIRLCARKWWRKLHRRICTYKLYLLPKRNWWTSDSITCWLPGPTIWILRRCSSVISKNFLESTEYTWLISDWWRRTSADNLSVSNQTNLAIKGIIAIEAMSNMSAVVNQTDDVNKYSVSATVLVCVLWMTSSRL